MNITRKPEPVVRMFCAQVLLAIAACVNASHGSAESKIPPIESPTPHLTELPLAPHVGGHWMPMKPGWEAWCEQFLTAQLNQPVDIEEARSKVVPFYSTPYRTVSLIEAIRAGRAGAYYLLVEDGGSNDSLLNGGGLVIQAANQAFGLRLNTPKAALAYLKFFVSALASEKGVFFIVEPRSGLMPAEVETQLGIKSAVISGNAESGWRIEADVIHDQTFANAEFAVSADGRVDMLSDKPRYELTLIYRVTMRNALRSHSRVDP